MPRIPVARDRVKEIERDDYYMRLADTVETGADCLGTKVGAVVVRENRVISTGYNGTPSEFPNCSEGGCVRCRDSQLYKQNRILEMSDPEHVSGAALDRCVCVHAEQNAFITAARFGIRVDGSILYTTQSPCFNCLKEAVQAGVVRVVYRNWYPAKYSDPLKVQYYELYNHLTEGDPTRFEAVGGGRPPLEDEGQPDPYEAEGEETTGMEPPDHARSP
jgi:dCMP deaminase